MTDVIVEAKNHPVTSTPSQRSRSKASTRIHNAQGGATRAGLVAHNITKRAEETRRRADAALSPWPDRDHWCLKGA